MTDALPDVLDAPPSRQAAWRRAVGPVGVWVGFVVVHALLFFLASRHPQALYGDPALYRQWASGGLHDGSWPVLDFDWVYPVGALVPITLPALVTTDPDGYRVAFMLLVTLLDAWALLAVLRASRGRTSGAWWWLGFLALLGPITLVRLDGVSAALTLVSLALLAPTAAHPRARTALASGLATFGAWIKIAPAAVVLPLLLTQRRPWRRVLAPAAAVCVVVVGVTAALGGASRALTFLTMQSTRGLQVESVFATPFSLARLWDDRFVATYVPDLNVIEIHGPGTFGAARLLDVLLVLAVVAVGWLTWRAARRLRDASPQPTSHATLELVLLSTAALTLALFVFDKVGSPQYVTWFAPPVVVALGVLDARARRRWRPLAAVLLAVAALTQNLFPNRYDDFYALAVPVDLWLEALRNLLIVVLLVLTLTDLARLGSRPRDAPAAGVRPSDATPGEGAPSV